MDRSARPSDWLPSAAVDARDADRPRPSADDVVRRAAADQAAADAARRRFGRERLPTIPPDERIAPLLEPGEAVVAVCHTAQLDRREPAPHTRLTPGVAGQLYVTTRRLVLVGRLTLSFTLDAIDEAVVSGERLLLVLRDGQGVAIEVPQPRLMWVEIAAARASLRSAQASGPRIKARPAAR